MYLDVPEKGKSSLNRKRKDQDEKNCVFSSKARPNTKETAFT